jgi:hypothetical protein
MAERVSPAASKEVLSDVNGTSRRSFHSYLPNKVVCKSVLLVTVTTVALIVVWGALTGITIVYVLPGSSENGMVRLHACGLMSIMTKIISDL